MKESNDILNAQEAAQFLGAHVETLRRLARKGAIPAFKLGKDWRFRREALIRWADENSVRKPSPRVLVVDDDAGFRKMVRRILEREGLDVLGAAGGEEGLEILRREKVDLVLLDLKMPVMSGPRFLGRMRELPGDPSIIIVTGYPDSDLMAEALSHGPLLLVAKPMEREVLLRAVHKSLGSKTMSG